MRPPLPPTPHCHPRAPEVRAPYQLVTKKPLAPRQENSRLGGAHELRKELRQENPKEQSKGKKDRTLSDTSNKSNLHVSSNPSSNSSRHSSVSTSQFTDITKVPPAGCRECSLPPR